MKRKHIFFIIFAITLLIAFSWDSVPVIKNSVHYVLDPTFGWLLNLDIQWGMGIIVAALALLMSMIHKFATDQNEMKKIKEEQKELQKELKACQNDPKKAKDCTDKQMALVKKNFSMSMNPMMFTFIPFILFFRYFHDVFAVEGAAFFGTSFLGFMDWFWFYLVFSMIFSIIWRKIFKIH